MDVFFITILFLTIICTFIFLLLTFIHLFKKNSKIKWYFVLFFISLSLSITGLLFFPITNREYAVSKKATLASLHLDSVPETVPLNQSNIMLSGTIENADKLVINNEPITIKSDQSFSTNIALREGSNRIKCVVSHTENKEIQEKVHIFTITRSNPTAELQLDSTAHTTNNTYTVSGTAQLGAKVTIYKDGYEVGHTQANSIKGWFNLKVDTKTSGNHTFTVEVTKANYKSTQQEIIVTRKLSKAEQVALNKKTAQTLDYKQLQKNPERFKGKYVTFKGQIIQISERKGRTDIRLSVAQTEKIWNYDDAIWIEHHGYTPFVEGDVITIYGVVLGQHSNNSSAGWNVTIPAIVADIIE